MISKVSYSIDDVAKGIDRAMKGCVLDGMSLPKEARILCDLLGEMIYQNETSVAVEGMPDQIKEILDRDE